VKMENMFFGSRYCKYDKKCGDVVLREETIKRGRELESEPQLPARTQTFQSLPRGHDTRQSEGKSDARDEIFTVVKVTQNTLRPSNKFRSAEVTELGMKGKH